MLPDCFCERDDEALLTEAHALFVVTSADKKDDAKKDKKDKGDKKEKKGKEEKPDKKDKKDKKDKDSSGSARYGLQARHETHRHQSQSLQRVTYV